jgi:hypothetical protein
MATGGRSKGDREKLVKLKSEELVILKSCKASMNSVKWCDQTLAADINSAAKDLEEARQVLL